MESLSRPPHRRKHSNATSAFSSSFSLKNPYDGVLLSNGGKKKPFEAHEYSEIFSGSSSIPVLDLSALDERVGSGDGRNSSKLDYANIFGGFRNDDVAVPYEELTNGGSAKKNSKPRIPTDARSPSQESCSQHSSEKTKRSSPEASDQSVDGFKQQVNMSFNRTSQRDNDASNGKTHIAQLHAVPGFTYFVDGASRLQKTEDNRPISSLKRGVSRTWSFSAELESVKGKGGLSGDKIRTSDNSLNENEVNFKSHFSKVPPTASRASAFASKQDASGRISGESSPSFFDEEFDENSVAAVSGAALKKAIDQAQESIRIAKMIMDRKKQGFQDDSKPSSRGRLKVKDKKETKIDNEGCGSKEKNVRERIERSDGKSISPLSHRDPFINAGKAEVERVRENVGAAKEHAETSNRESKISAPFCSQGEILHINEKVVMEKLEKNVESAEADFRTANWEFGQVGSGNSFLVSTDKIVSRIEEMEAVKETLQQREVTTYHMKGPDIVEKLSERTLDAPKRMEQYQDTFDHAEGPTEIVELADRVLNTSQRTPEQEKIVDEAGENLGIMQENEVTEEKETVTDDKEKGEEKFEEFKEMLNVKYLTAKRLEFDDLLNESGNLVEKEVVEKEEGEKKVYTVPEWEEENSPKHGKTDVDENAMGQKESQIWFESEEQLKEALEEEINERTPEIYDKKENHVYDEKDQILPEKLEQNEVDERHMNVYDYEATENVATEANNFVEAKKSELLPDVEETNNTISEDNHNKCEFQEFAYEKDIDEAVDVNNSDSSTVFSESREACYVDINSGAEDYQREEMLTVFYKDNEADQLFLREDNEMPEIDILHRSASEEVLFENELHDSFEGPSANAKRESFGYTEADHEEKLPNEDTLERNSEIHDDSQECADKIDRENLPQVNSSNDKPEEFDIAYLRQMLEQASESDEGCTSSTSSVENIDGSSAHESEECAENANEKASDEEKLEYEIETTSNESKHEERNEEMDKSMETETPVEKDNVIKIKNFDKNDHQQRIEAIKKGREREKDRIAVERAIREARERAFTEARERAERAAVERAAAEVRQRAMSEAREKLEKVNKQPADKASIEAKLRAERAAVERATAEARQRALEKAMSQKTFSEAKTQAERVSSSSRNNGLNQSSDLEKSDGSNTESAQRRKARLERHQRIMERAAKALEEKNMRDLLAQKEQAERNRLAESLDAEVKRWATGKEGNLRALLSTLQYILGAGSAWQPISLTEIITTAAVKKAYRKATLYVHPDKLQQRGATIHQKYICEKVFDLLKAAWSRFNSEER